MTVSPTYALPPQQSTADGAPRAVGVEIEYAGPSFDAVVSILQDCFGGDLRRENAFRYHVDGTRFGDFTVEMDASLLGKEKYVEVLGSLGVPVAGSWMQGLLRRIGMEVDPEATRSAIDELIEGVAGVVVPYEIVTPPIPLEALPELDALVASLHASGAEGTSASLLHVFGLHLNPDVPSLEVGELLATFRAALLLYEWIAWVGEVDAKRRLSPFIDPFPDAYRKKVLDLDYAPDLDRFADDYLATNPTRNRWLDLLPLLAEYDAERVRAAAEEPDLVKARPTFHYRLPNSMIDDPGWSIATEWNRWVMIERLAASPDWLEPMCVDCLAMLDAPGGRRRWLRRSAQWLETWALSPPRDDGS